MVKWLETQSGQSGMFTLCKACEVTTDPCLPGSPLPLITDSSVLPSWAQFCLESYTQNLKSIRLGHTLLYADVIMSTMDLLEG